MKKLVSIVLTLMMVCAAAAVVAEESYTYTSKENGFSFQYPGTWRQFSMDDTSLEMAAEIPGMSPEVVQAAMNGVEALFLVQDTEAPGMVTVVVAAMPGVTPELLGSDMYAAAMKAAMEASFAGTEATIEWGIEPRVYDLDGEPVIEYMLIVDLVGIEQNMYQVTRVMNEVGYMFAFTSYGTPVPESAQESVLSAMQSIEASAKTKQMVRP